MRISILIIVFVTGLTSLRAEVSFCGYMRIGEHPLFVLSVGKEDQSNWLKICQSYSGYRICSFDLKKELLVVEKDGLQESLPLEKRRVKPGRMEPKRVDKMSLKSVDGKTILKLYALYSRKIVSASDDVIAEMGVVNLQLQQKTPEEVLLALREALEKQTGIELVQLEDGSILARKKAPK